MSELSTQESSDDLDPISEGSPSKTLDEDKHESSSENDETLDDDDDDDDNETKQEVQEETNFQNNDNTLDTANANLQITDNQNNIPVSKYFFPIFRLFNRN